MRLKSCHALLEPQPTIAIVLKEILNWIDEEDLASQREPSLREQGAYNPDSVLNILRHAPDNWWLTEFERRTKSSSEPNVAPEAEHEEIPKDDGSDTASSDCSDEEFTAEEGGGNITMQNLEYMCLPSRAQAESREPDCKRLCVKKTDHTPAPSVSSSSKRHCSRTHFAPLLPDQAWGERFFETQTPGMAQCGKHALNNVLGGPQFLPLDMEDACARVMAQTGEDRAEHSKDHGWYSHSVLAEACDAVANATGIRLELRPLPLHPTTIHDEQCRGAVVNIHNAHWTAVVKHEDHFWYVDSCDRRKQMMMGDMEALLQRHPATFAVVSSDYELPEMQ